MTHRIFSRRYRPQRFAELFGQEHVVRMLGVALAQGRIGQAYLFTGPRGVGKTTTARILARALNCAARTPPPEEGLDTAKPAAAPQGTASQNTAPQKTAPQNTRSAAGGTPIPEPCGTCSSCIEIAAGSDLDVVEIDAASNNQVDDIRALREQVGYSTVRSRYRIWIVDEVHMLSTAAFNAFLKTLEEPPPRVKFFFCTTELDKLPDTIVSRCTRIELRPVDETAIVARLAWLAEQEGLALEEGLGEAIARSARGGLRDAESMLEQLAAATPDGLLRRADWDRWVGRAPEEQVDALFAAIEARNASAALDAVGESLAHGARPGVLLDQWLDRLRILLARAARGGQPLARCAQSIDLLLAKRAHLRTGADGALVLEVAAIELARLPDARDLDRLLAACGGPADEPEASSSRGAPAPAASHAPPTRSSEARGSPPRPHTEEVQESSPSGRPRGALANSRPPGGAPAATAVSVANTSVPAATPSVPVATPSARGATPSVPTATPSARGATPSVGATTTSVASAPASVLRSSAAPDAHSGGAGPAAVDLGSAATLDGVLARWPILLEALKGREPRLVAALAQARPVALRGDVVEIEVDGEAEARMALIQAPAQAAFGQVAPRVFGRRIQLVVLAAAGGARTAVVDAAARALPAVRLVAERTGGHLLEVVRRTDAQAALPRPSLPAAPPGRARR